MACSSWQQLCEAIEPHRKLVPFTGKSFISRDGWNRWKVYAPGTERQIISGIKGFWRACLIAQRFGAMGK